MKKLVSTVLLLAMVLSLLAGCTLVPTDNSEGLENAKQYIINYFQGSNKETAVDYTVIGSVPVDGVTYTITWTTDKENIKVVPQDNGMVLIDVPELTSEKVAYTLTATIAAPNGDTIAYSIAREIPAAVGIGKTDEDIVKEAYELADGEVMEGTATLTGVVARIKTPFDPGYSNITVILVVGDLKDKPIECYRMKGEGADTLAPGDTITVTGTLKNYSGTIAFDAGCALTKVVKGPAVSCPATDAEVIAAAKALDDGWSLPYKATMTGVVTEITSAYDAKYMNLSVKITVGDENFECYRLVGEDGANIAVGDTITVTGYMMNWKGVVQFGQGCTLDSRVPGEGGEVTPPAEAPEMEVVDDPVVGTPYKFGMVQVNVDSSAVYYLSGGMAQTYYLATNTDVTKALDLYLEEAEGGYYLYYLTGDVKTYINMVVSGTHVNAVYGDTASTVYTYDASLSTLKISATVSGTTEDYLFGTRCDNTYTTVGFYKASLNPFYCQFYAEVVPSDCEHTGGTATCTEKAVCDLCGEAYGSLLDHVGGTATCTEKAVCDTCGNAYGSLLDHVGGTATCTAKAVCTTCGNAYGSLLDHVGGTATCTAKAVCTTCGEAYGDLADHNYVDDVCPACGTEKLAAPFADGDKVVIVCSAYNKALSSVATGYYLSGVDVTVTDGVVSGYADTEVWTVIANADGSYSFAVNGQNLGMQDSYSSISLGAVNDDWNLVPQDNGTYALQNTVRGNYIEWYAEKNNWSSYNPSTLSDLFYLSFYVVG